MKRRRVAVAAMHGVVLVLAGLILVAAGGCQRERKERRPPTPLDMATVGAITGEVRFSGSPPAETVVQMGSARDCAALHAGPVGAGDVLVHDGKVENALVYVKQGLGDRVFAVPDRSVVIDQKGCLFVPRVAAAQTGQPIRFENSDALQHNVHGVPEHATGWNFSLAMKGASRTIDVEDSEPAIEIKCDIHPWMRAYLGVFDHPYFAVTGPDGRFKLESLPPGTYLLEAWHERFGTRTATVTLAPSGTETVVFTFGAP